MSNSFVLTVDQDLAQPVTVTLTIVGSNATVVSAGAAAAIDRAVLDSPGALNPVEAVLLRLQAYDPSPAIRALHERMVEQGWSPRAPMSRSDPSEPSERAYLRYLAGSGDRRIALYLDTLGIGCYSATAQQVVDGMDGSSEHTRGVLFRFNDGIANVEAAVDRLWAYACGK